MKLNDSNSGHVKMVANKRKYMELNDDQHHHHQPTKKQQRQQPTSATAVVQRMIKQQQQHQQHHQQQQHQYYNNKSNGGGVKDDDDDEECKEITRKICALNRQIYQVKKNIASMFNHHYTLCFVKDYLENCIVRGVKIIIEETTKKSSQKLRGGTTKEEDEGEDLITTSFTLHRMNNDRVMMVNNNNYNSKNNNNNNNNNNTNENNFCYKINSLGNKIVKTKIHDEITTIIIPYLFFGCHKNWINSYIPDISYFADFVFHFKCIKTLLLFPPHMSADFDKICNLFPKNKKYKSFLQYSDLV